MLLAVHGAGRGRSSFYELPPSPRRWCPQAAYYAPATAAAAALTFELAMPTWPELSPDSSIIVVSI